MLKGDKYFELIETTKPPEVMRVYKDRNSSLIYSTRLTNKGFALLLTFSSAFMLSDLGILLDAFLDRRSYNDALIVSKIRFLFQLDRDGMARWVYQ
jgi:hypothetical protein